MGILSRKSLDTLISKMLTNGYYVYNISLA